MRSPRSLPLSFPLPPSLRPPFPLSLLLLSTLAPLATSCASAPPPPEIPIQESPPATAGASATPEQPPAAPINVLWADTTPEQPVIDGKIAEWGGFPDASAVAVALTKDAAFLVADLTGAAKDGVWVALSAPVDEVPKLGTWQRDGQFIDFTCPEEAASPEAVSCKQTLARHDAFVAARTARFERLFRLDGQGLRWSGKNGLEPVPGAVVASKAAGNHWTVEVKLPLSALPRMAQAPVSSLTLFAVAGPEAKVPAILPEQRTEVYAASDVSFEPHGELRAAARIRVVSTGFSYHPAQPNLIEIVDHPDKVHGGSSLEATERVLWEPVTKMGDVEVGYVHLDDTYLGIFKASAVVDLELLVGEPRGFVERNKALHFFVYDQHGYDPIDAWVAVWNVKAVDAEGKVTEPIEGDFVSSGWTSVEEFHTDTFDRFGIRGQPWALQGEPSEAPLEITWKLDKKTGKYLPKRGKPSIPAAAKKKP